MRAVAQERTGKDTERDGGGSNHTPHNVADSHESATVEVEGGIVETDEIIDIIKLRAVQRIHREMVEKAEKKESNTNTNNNSNKNANPIRYLV